MSNSTTSTNFLKVANQEKAQFLHWLLGSDICFAVHLSSLIPRMSMFTLIISCLTTSNLPWFMDLTFQVPMQYCSLQHWTLLPSPITSQLGVVSFWLCLFILSGVISPRFSSSVLGTYQPVEFVFQCLTFLPFHTVHGILKARILKWFAIPFVLSELSTMTCLSLVALYCMNHIFIELDKTVVHMISLIGFLWLWF